MRLAWHAHMIAGWAPLAARSSSRGAARLLHLYRNATVQRDVLLVIKTAARHRLSA